MSRTDQAFDDFLAALAADTASRSRVVSAASAADTPATRTANRTVALMRGPGWRAEEGAGPLGPVSRFPDPAEQGRRRRIWRPQPADEVVAADLRSGRAGTPTVRAGGGLPTTLRLLRTTTAPALVVGRFLDVLGRLAWNPLAGSLLGAFTQLLGLCCTPRPTTPARSGRPPSPN
ncbi:hypothetical protein [Streptomyces sp. NPDC003015]